MTIAEAMKESGLSHYTLKCEAAKGSFEAWKPRGKRGGWEIDPQGFRIWLLRRKLKNGNAPMRAKVRRELEALGQF